MDRTTDKSVWLWLAVVGVLLFVRWQGWDGPPTVVVTTKATAATYTYDDKRHSIPPPVAAAISKLNEQGIEADLDEVDTNDASGEVPEQFKVSRPAAVAAGLPALVVLAGDKVLKVVPNPTTEAAVMEAVK